MRHVFVVVALVVAVAVPAAAQSDPGGVERIFGPDRIATATAISFNLWPDQAASVAVVARADVAADALAATPLAVTGPLLLSPADRLPDSVADELVRVLPPDATVVLAGGPAALSDQVADDIAALGLTPVRAAGPDRAATAVAIAELVAQAPERIYLADGDGFADAMAAGSAAGRHGDAVVMLTRGQDVPAVTADAVGRHPDAEVVAVGAAAAAAAGDLADRTIVGVDVYDTAAKVAADVASAGPAGTVALASGENFPDGLAGGAHAAAQGIPLLLTARDGLPDTTRAATDALGVTDLVVYGGTAAISTTATGQVFGIEPVAVPHGSLVISSSGRIDAVDSRTLNATLIATLAADDTALVDVSPDRRQVTFTDGAGRLVVTNADGSDEQVLSTVPAGYEYYGTPRWSPDGTQVAVAATRNTDPSFPTLCSDIFIFPAAAIAQPGTTRPPVHQAGGVINGLDWTPDGGRLVYANDQISSTVTCNDQQVGLWTVGIDGTSPAPLTNERDGNPTVRADGTVAFHRQLDCSACGRDLFTVRLDGSALTQLTAGSRGSWPEWSPDGTQLVYTVRSPSNPSQDLIRILDPATGTVTGLANIDWTTTVTW